MAESIAELSLYSTMLVLIRFLAHQDWAMHAAYCPIDHCLVASRLRLPKAVALPQQMPGRSASDCLAPVLVVTHSSKES